MRDPKRFGRELAERMVTRMRAKNLSGNQALRRVASEVAGTANSMVAEGKRHEDVLRWVEEVQRACAERVEEQLLAAEEQNRPTQPEQ